jgi:L-fuconolactonase
MPFELIDGYCHCGLRKYRPLEVVNRIMNRFGVQRAVLVQHLGEYDNGYIQSVVEGDPERFVGVMHVDAEDPAAGKQLRSWFQTGGFRGIRLVATTLQTHASLWQDAAEMGLNLVVFEDPTLADHDDDLGRFASNHPEISMILSHLGMLLSAEAPHYHSQAKILGLAQYPNVFVQLSGFHMFARTPYEGIVPVIRDLFTAFGPERLYYGSNFPVMGDDAIYGAEIELLGTGRLGIPRGATPQVMAETAMSLWFTR